MKKNVYDVFNISSNKVFFNNKKLFLETFHVFVHRVWYDTKDLSQSRFTELLSERKLLYKPVDSMGGKGICLAQNIVYQDVSGRGGFLKS